MNWLAKPRKPQKQPRSTKRPPKKERPKAKPKPAAKPKLRAKPEPEPQIQLKVTEHLYVPKHEIFPPSEAQPIFAQYNARPEQLPHILSSDPVVKEIGAKPGDLVRIVRQSETAGATAYYRLVVEGGL